MAGKVPWTDLPDIGRINGAVIDDGSLAPPQMHVTIDYSGKDGTVYHLKMPFLDAMYLLNLLKAAQEDIGFFMPEDPFLPPTGPPKKKII